MATVIIPNDQYSLVMLDEMGKLNNIIDPSNGLISLGGAPQVMSGGKTFTWRLQEALSGSYVDITAETTSLTPTSLDQAGIVGVQQHIGKAWFTAKFNDVLIGSDTVRPAIIRDVANLAAQEAQARLAACVKGAFASASASPFINDVSAVGDGTLTFTNIVDTIAAKYPEKMEGFLTHIVMHPLQFAELLQGQAIEYKNTEYGASVSTNGGLPFFAGLRVVTNSVMCAPIVEDGKTKYPSFIVAPKAFNVDYQRSLELKVQEDILKGGGSVNYASYFALFTSFHAGSWIAADGTATTIANLATGTNWEMKYFDTQNVKATMIKTILKS